MDSFKDKFDSFCPLFIDLIILPFKDELVHEGLFMNYNISMGRNTRSSIKAEAEEAIKKYGVISSFTKKSEKMISDEELLRFYMKSEFNRDRFWKEIDHLTEKSELLESIYNYEIARINSKDIRRQIKCQGLNGHFAVLFSQVIASGKDKKELEQNINKMLPKEKLKEIYAFKI